MAVVMDGDFVALDDADATTGWTGRAPFSNLGTTAAGRIEGAFCIDARLQLGTGDATYNSGAQFTIAAAIADDGGVFTDETTPANNATANDMTLLPAVPVSGDAYIFGRSHRFGRITLNTGTIGVGTYTVAWEYWNGSSFTALSGVTDGTVNFKTAGSQTVVFTVPADWVPTTINGQGPYFFIRAVVDGGTVTTTPIGTQVFGDLDLTDRHIYSWFRPSSPVDTFANAGITMRISGTAAGATNYGQWNVGGSDLGIVGSGGWINMTVDLLLAFDTSNGTPPEVFQILDAGLGGKFLSGPGMGQICLDAIVVGTTAIIRGGTGGDKGTWEEAAAADLAFGHIKEIAGAIFINSRVRFGDLIGVTSTEFSDVDAVILFETNMLIAGDLAGIEFAGNSTGTNNAQIGASSGSGVDKVGSSGGTWKAAGDRPFRVEAKNADMDLSGIFGVTMVGPAALFDDNLRNFKQEDNSAGTFLDFTREANDSTANDASPFPAGAGANDAVYFGHNVRWYELNVNTGTAGAGTYTVAWEYWNGSSWVALTDLSDGTTAFKTTGLQVVTFAIPDDWALTSIDNDSRYWIRARRDAGTVTTDPDITQCSIALAGDVELEDSAAEMISCVLSSMGAVRIRGGAFCKKTTIASSVTTAKHAAVDLGGADPAADTVRDLTIVNNINGLLLKGSGDVTYNLRNFQFSGNTKDVRLDFGSGDTVTVNLLEGTKALVAGDFDNVNGTTLVINNIVTLTVTVVDEAAVAVPYATVRIEQTDGTLVAEGVANNLGVFTSSFNFSSPLSVNLIVRKTSPGDTRYNTVFTPATIEAAGLSVTIGLTVDTRAGLLPAVGVMRTGARSEDEAGNAIQQLNIDVPDTGTSRKLLVGIMYWDSGTNLTVSSITYDGNPMTVEAGASAFEQEGAGNFHEIAWYRFDLPDSDEGVKEVIATWSANVAIKGMCFAILDDVATGAVHDSATQTGDQVTTNPSVSLNNTAQPAWSIVFGIVDDVDSPSATGVATIKRSDEVVDGLKSMAVLCAERLVTGAHSLGVDYGSNSKTWVFGGVSVLKN